MSTTYKVLCVCRDDDAKVERKIFPMLVSPPEGIKITNLANEEEVSDEEKRATVIRTWASKIHEEKNIKKDKENRWHWRSDWCYFTEFDARNDVLFQKFFEVVDWDSVEPSWLKKPRNSDQAGDYCEKVRQPVPEYEHLLAKDAGNSYNYAISCLGERFVLGEPEIAKDTYYSIQYCERFNCRLREAEPMLALNKSDAENYAGLMRRKELWADWTVEDLSRSPVWLFNYAKDYVKGPLPDHLHSVMMLFSFNDSKNEYVQRYFKTKRYQPKHLRAPAKPRIKKVW